MIELKLVTYREEVRKVKEMEKKAPKKPNGKANLSAYLRGLTDKDLKTKNEKNSNK